MNPGTRRALNVAALLVPLAAIIAAGMPVCPTASVMGVPCPGCGLTRATLAALSGNFGEALRLHPLVFVIMPGYLGVLGAMAYRYVRGPRPHRGAAPTSGDWLMSRPVSVAAAILVALLIGVWGARFLGYLGGPVPVESLHGWATRALR